MQKLHKANANASPYQYKLSYTISNNIDVYEGPVPQAKKMPHCAVKFEAGEENITVEKSLYCSTNCHCIKMTFFVGNIGFHWIPNYVHLFYCK